MISSENNFSSLETIHVKFYIIAAGVPSVLDADWKLGFEEVVVLALGHPTAPSGVKRPTDDPLTGGSWWPAEVWVGLGLGLSLAAQLVVESRTE